MIAIKVPTLGESIVEATVSRWLKKEGDMVAVGDALVELETDKITVEVTAMNAGLLSRLAHGEGDVVKVDDVLAEIDENGTAAAASNTAGRGVPGAANAAPVAPPAMPPAAQPPAAKPMEAARPASPPVRPSPAEFRASPAAERLAAERGVDLSTV